MAEFRTIHSKMWRDPWFTDLDVEGKLLWVYLITNHAASLTGIYYLPAKFAAFETGLGQERVETLLAQFVLSGKIEYENCVVWIKRMRRYQAQNESSPKIKPRIEKDLAEIPDCKVKRIYLEQYPINTLLIPSHTDTETNIETEQSGAAHTASVVVEKCPKEWMTALYNLCAIDIATASPGYRRRISQCGITLIKSNAQPADLDRFKAWWLENDWRGKKGDAPTPEQVRDCWGKMNGNFGHTDPIQKKPTTVYR